MTFLTQTFQEFNPEEIELLKTTPPTHESHEIAEKIGKRMGELAYPGDMVRESIDYEADRLGWPGEISRKIGRLAWDGLQSQ